MSIRYLSSALVFCLTFILLWSIPLHALDFSTFVVRGFEGKGPLEFLDPEDIATTNDGNLIIVDQKNNRLQILTKDGDFVKFIPSVPTNKKGSKLEPISKEDKNALIAIRKVLKSPCGIALKNDEIYVSCTGSHQIAVFNLSTGKMIRTIGKWGHKQGELTSPMDVDLSPSNKIAVAEWRNKRVQILSNDGKCIKELIYQKESKKGHFIKIAPRGVHWVDDTMLLVTYPLFNQVVCWNSKSGEVLWRYGIKGRGRGMLNNPSYVTSGPNGNFLISDTKNNRIVEISKEGKFVYNYKMGKGTAPGNLITPRGLVLLQDNSLAVCDQGNNRLELFRPGQVTTTLLEIKDLAIQDKWKEALPKIDKVLYLQPNNVQARDLMVNALYHFGDEALKNENYVKAEECFRKVLRYRPNDPNIPKKLDEIFWASNQGLITNIIFGIIALIVSLLTIWLLKVVIYRFILRK